MNYQDPAINFYGWRIHTNPALVDVVVDKIKRTWKERLLTRPWTPFQAYRFQQRLVPQREVVVSTSMRIMFCHPDVLDEIKKQISQHNQVVSTSYLN